MKSQPARRGRPAQYVKGRDGKPVVGLSLHRPTGTYYATHSKPRKYFSKDFDQAHFLFRQWELQQQKDTTHLHVASGLDPDDEQAFAEAVQQEYELAIDKYGTVEVDLVEIS